MKIYAFQHTSVHTRFKSSSGGFFTYLAERVLNWGGVIYGASFNSNWEVEHKSIEDSEDLHILRKSKYVFSDLLGTLDDAEKKLKEGRKVLFTGTPCQIAALKKKLSQDYDNLLTAEVICHGAPQPRAWNLYLDDLLVHLNKKRTEIINIDFRDKSTGWEKYSFTIHFSDGNMYTEPGSQNLFMRLFLTDYIIKRGCFNCPFKHPNSKADITMGDLWGMSQILPDHHDQLGTSVVIANTPKGETLIKDITYISELTLQDVAKYNSALITSPIMPPNYDKFNKKLVSGTSFLKIGKKQLEPTIPQRVRGIVSRLCRKILSKFQWKIQTA